MENISEIVVRVEKNKTRFNAVDANGNVIKGIFRNACRKAFNNNKALQRSW